MSWVNEGSRLCTLRTSKYRSNKNKWFKGIICSYWSELNSTFEDLNIAGGLGRQQYIIKRLTWLKAGHCFIIMLVFKLIINRWKIM
jgi:hypothetical protein